MVQQKATVKNDRGIHCRPAAVIIKAIQHYEGAITLDTAAGSCNAKSIMGLLGLCMDMDTEVTITVEGPDAEIKAQEVAALIETRFDFPEKE